MYLHANAKLGLAGRLALVRAIEGGLSLKAAAAAFKVSPATAHRWWHRWLDGERQAAALLDRSSRPHRSPRLLAAELQERICDCRRETVGFRAWSPARPALPTRRCGRCSSAPDSRAAPQRLKTNCKRLQRTLFDSEKPQRPEVVWAELVAPPSIPATRLQLVRERQPRQPVADPGRADR